MKQIELVHRHIFALVDDEDYYQLNKFNWYYHKTESNIYAKTEINGNPIMMHQMVLSSPSGKLTVDHINGNGLDNRKENLRLATRSQKRMNQRKTKNTTTSKFKGVSWCNREKSWRAYIHLNGKFKSLGYFNNEIRAARAYNDAAIQHYKEFANLNSLDN